MKNLREFYIGSVFGFWACFCTVQFSLDLNGKEKIIDIVTNHWTNNSIWTWPLVFLGSSIPILFSLIYTGLIKENQND